MGGSAIFWVACLVTAVIGALLVFGAARRVGQARAAASWPSARPARLARPLGWLGIALGLLALAGAAALSLAALVGPARRGPLPQDWRGWLIAAVVGVAVLAAGVLAARGLVAHTELTALIRTPPRSGEPTPEPGTETPTQRPGEETRSSPPAATGQPPAEGAAIRQVPGERAATEAAAPTQRAPEPVPPQPRPTVAEGDPAVPEAGRPGWVYRDPAGAWYLCVATEGGRRLVRLTDFTLVPVGAAGTPLSLAGSVEISVFPVTDRMADAP